MGLPASLTYHDERYPYIILTPIGKKNKQIRSIGHKFERGILSRVNEAISEYVAEKKINVRMVQTFLNINGDALLPVSFSKDDTLHPHLLKPEFFLWKNYSAEHGLPLKAEYRYETDITRLSSEQLERHIRQVIDDYIFVAAISLKSRDEWLEQMTKGFHRHPIVELMHEKKHTISSIETMNQSALLSLLKYPEDVSLWRNRVDIVMRPFRTLPQLWVNDRYSSCPHNKELRFISNQSMIQCACEACDSRFYYFTEGNEVLLEEEFDVLKVRKRVDTVHKQFNEVADQNTDLLYQLRQLSFLKERFHPYLPALAEALQLAEQIERYKVDEPLLDAYPLLEMHKKLSQSNLPIDSFESNLIWLSHIQLADVTMVKQVEVWLENLPEDMDMALEKLLHELKERLNEVAYQDDDIIITVKGRALDYHSVQHVLDLVHYYGTDYPAHTLVQVLAGKSTNKLRRLHLHETRWFGMLADWPEKHIQRLFNQLEKKGWLMKQQKGYSISQFAEEVM
ncbi:RQC-minor-2 family DNA-binding protein [Halobacillus sp. B23F22_1]|uniref:RQC-minor-2 family DNA-binding protein n=1 Tax=Halobacillus sp. B23F22_1 TaxID=3459514 RepID=UPI00373DF833